MAQTVSPGFRAALRAGGQRLADYLEVSWTGAGSIAGARGSSGWTDETQYLLSHEGQLRLNAPAEELTPPGDVGSATVTLWDPGRFDYTNPEGDLYALIGGPVGLTGKLLRLWQGLYVDGSPEYVCIFTGVITDWRPDYANSAVILTVKDLSALYLQDKQSSPLYTYQRPDVWIAKLADDGYMPAGGSRLLDPGIFTTPYCWMDDESLVEEMWEAARADSGTVYFDQTGRLRFENVLHWLGAEHRTPVWTFRQGDFARTEPAYSTDDVATVVVSEWSGRGLGIPLAVYNLDAPKVIPPGQSVTWEARYSHPVSEILPLQADYLDPRDESKNKLGDYAATSSGGAVLTPYVGFTFTELMAQKCKVTCTNSHPTLTARLFRFQIRGRPLIGGPTEQVDRRAAPAPYPYERKRQIRGNLYVQTAEQGQAYVDYLAEKHKRIRPVYSIPGALGVPQLELGDRVAWEDWETFGLEGYLPDCLTPEGYLPDGYLPQGNIIAISWTSSREEGFLQTLQALDTTGLYPYDNYFIIGVTALGAHGRSWY